MAFVTKEELLELKKTNPAARVYNYGVGYHDAEYVDARYIDEAKADEILSSGLRTTLEVRQQKTNRPWEIVNLTSKLDKSQPWLGFEFEMGFDLKKDYDKLINHLWKNTTHVAIDREGYGQYCPEVTFSPENLDSYMNGTSTIHGVINWMNENKVKLANFGDTYVGTHLNLSTPGYRNGDAATRRNVLDLINHSILTMTPAEHTELFGRKPYGLGTAQDSWVEFKMFKSTDDAKQFEKYIQVSKNMAEVMERLMMRKSTPAAYDDGKVRLIANLADILRGKVTVTQRIYKEVNDNGAMYHVARSHWRARNGTTYPNYQTTGVIVPFGRHTVTSKAKMEATKRYA
jgi:hypothetical protein